MTVQAGVTRKQLNDEINNTGLFFPIDPGADATLGGMSATRASGTNAVRYGTMRENVLGLTVVTASGEVIHTGTRARKSSAGYDLTRLMVGSEGTLGVMTEITLQALPAARGDLGRDLHLPEHRGGGAHDDPDHPAGRADRALRAARRHAVRAVNPHDKLSLREAPMLLMEFHGSAASVKEQAATVQEIASEHGGDASSGRPRPKSAPGSGPRATTPTSPACR